MASEEDAGYEVFAESIADPDHGVRRLPSVVGHLDAPEPAVRVCAAWTCCFLAVRDGPDTVEYVVRELSGRLADEPTLEVTQALDYLAAKYPEQVERVLTELRSEELPLPPVGAFTRMHFYQGGESRARTGATGAVTAGDGTETADPGDGSTAPEAPDGQAAAEGPEGHSAGDAQTTSTEPAGATADGSEDGGGSAGAAPERAGADDEVKSPDEWAINIGDADDTVDAEELEALTQLLETEEESDEPEESEDERLTEADLTDGTKEMVREMREVNAVVRHSRFTNLTVRGTRDETRYADVYEALLGEQGGSERVAMRMFREPALNNDRIEFEQGLREDLEAWASVDDHPHVLTVLDWGTRPQPWLSTLYSGGELADETLFDPDQALADARALTAAVAHMHERGVVHAGIDPKSVAYPNAVLGQVDDEPPLLDNVAILRTYREHFDPANFLDPRYAAPEYFDDSYGRVDHATDIYGLGATIFRLFTGRAPFDGAFDRIRESVLNRSPPPPSAVADGVPEAVDEVISKAMAKQKLVRYETVEHMQRELAAITNG
jgi:hypothetical protein